MSGNVQYALTAVLFSAQLVVSTALFTLGLERRTHFMLRAIVSSAAFATITTLWMWLGAVRPGALGSIDQVILDVGGFCMSFFLLVPLLMTCYRTSVWTALFCATCGYTVQNLMAGILDTTGTALIGRTLDSTDGLAFYVGVVVSSVLVLWVCYLVCARHMIDGAPVHVGRSWTLLMMVAVVIVDIVANRYYGGLLGYGVPAGDVLIIRLGHTVACAITLTLEFQLLYMRHLEVEMAVLEGIRMEEERQYELSARNVEAINAKCHDIRHHIMDLGSRGLVVDAEALADLAHEVDVYDCAMKTGNPTLDVVLTEKGLACERLGIRLACIAEGEVLGFMSPTDIYALFGNAIENAIEATERIEDTEQRLVVVNLCQRMEAVSLSVENYYEGELSWADGLPTTTKGDRESHGYGMRSIASVVERYGGTLVVRGADGVFRLNALFPATAA